MRHETQSESCVVCGGKSHHVVCSGSALRDHQQFLREFHSRRLERASDGTIPSSVLADRVQFSQGHLTDVVECDHCALIFRDPRPDDDEITERYAADHYDAERLQTIHNLQLADSRQRASYSPVAGLILSARTESASSELPSSALNRNP